MKTSLNSFRQHFRETLLSFLWREWSAIGVAGRVGSRDNDWIIDPEALLLFSTVLARHDARLFDEILDWLNLNADAISLQRLTRMRKEQALGDASLLAAIAVRLTQNKAHPRWRTVVERSPSPAADATPQLLFPDLPAPVRCDAQWLKAGWQRPSLELRGLSQTPRPGSPATFIFKLRSLFGLQTRAEVMAWLLANGSGHPAEIARATGYFRVSIQTVLNELEKSGHLFMLREGKEKKFGLRPDEWRFLISPGATTFPRWLPWSAIFGLLQRIHALLNHPGLGKMSPELLAIELGNAIKPAEGVLTSAGLWTPLPAHMTGATAVDATLARVQRLLDRIG